MIRKLKKIVGKNTFSWCLPLVAGVLCFSAFSPPYLSQAKWVREGILLPVFHPEACLQVRARAYTTEESRYFLKHNLVGNGVQPIEITVENHSDRKYSLCPSSLDISQLSAQDAVSRVFRSTIPRQIALKVIGFFFWPVSIPGTIDGLYIHASRKKLTANYLAKGLKKEGETVLEYTTFHRVIFVPKKEMASAITFDLIDLDTFSQKHITVPIEKES